MPARPVPFLLLLTLLLAPAVHGAPVADEAAIRGALQPAVDLVAGALKPVYTRVLSVKENRVWFEPVAAVEGEQFAIYPEGTILTGPAATSPRPEPIATATIDHVTAEYAAATLDAPTGVAVPVFAPAGRRNEDRSLVVVWDIDAADPEVPALASELYALLFATIPVPITSAKPAMAEGTVIPHPALVDTPATDILLIYGRQPTFAQLIPASKVADVESRSPHGVVLHLPGDNAGWVSLFMTPPHERIEPRSQGGVDRYRLPGEAACDCVWVGSPVMVRRLWCITEAGLQGYALLEGGLESLGAMQVPWFQAPPYRQAPSARVANVPVEGTYELWAHLGHGGQGFRLETRSGRFEIVGAIAGIPVQANDSGDVLLVQTDPSYQQRYTLTGATFGYDVAPESPGIPPHTRGIRDLLPVERGVLIIDAAGALVHLDPAGKVLAKLAGPYGSALGSDGEMVLAGTPDGRLARVLLDPALGALTEVQRSPKLGRWVIAVIGRSDPRTVDTPVWVLVRAETWNHELVAVGPAAWKGKSG
ncbi:MAG TPA: hypothetical protein VEI97_19505 [bacterium]|nr:hypothetical protein [bacterium]